MNRALVVVGLLLCVALPCRADGRFRFKLDHKIRVWLATPSLRAEQQNVPAAQLVAPLLIRFAGVPGAAKISELNADGVHFYPGSGGGLLHVGAFFPARATRGGLAALEGDGMVRQVDLDAVLDPALPLQTTSRLIFARQAWARQVQGSRLSGKGRTFGLLDTGIDVHHPDFFHADGGLHAWIDVDSDNIFTPGTDAVDLDGDGKAGSGETLHNIDAVVYDRYSGKPMLGSKNNTFDPTRDWLFADKNQNGKRDYGSKAGFTDSSPAFGEPLFVVEDLDGDGLLDPEEKLVLLKTSKVRAVWSSGGTRTRGKDLIKTDLEKDSSHGTCTSGILLGGPRGRHDWVGIAPDAELLLGADYKSTSFGKMLTWLVQSKVDVVLHEYAPWVGYHLDGSSNHEGLMDAAAKTNKIPQVTPAGNLGGANKHMQTKIQAGSYAYIPIHVPGPSSAGTHVYMHLSLLWRNTKSKLKFTLQDPVGYKNVLPTTASGTTWLSWGDNKTLYFSVRQDSSRGTALMDIYVQGVGTYPNLQPIASGTWKLWAQAPATTGNVLLWGFVRDAISRWGKGIQFTTAISEEGIVCWPATADSAITLGAYAGHVGLVYEPIPSGDKQGDLRKYSGRGARIDGAQVMDITAPDNPVSPYNERPGYNSLGAYRLFGGTSGAGPHVAGAALLMKQHTPSLDGIAVRTAMRKHALVDGQVGAVPSDKWGYGKLRLYHSIYGAAPVANTAPVAKIKVSKPIYAGTAVTLEPQVSDVEDGKSQLKIRWDDGYDGKWDTALGPVQKRNKTFAKAGMARIKLQVVDSGKLEGEAAVLLEVLPALVQPDGKVTPTDQGQVDLVLPDQGPADAPATDLVTADLILAPDARATDGKPADLGVDVALPDQSTEAGVDLSADLVPAPDLLVPDRALPDRARDKGPVQDWRPLADSQAVDTAAWQGPTKPEEQGCSCGVGGSGTGRGWLLTLLLLLGGLGRRRWDHGDRPWM